ncbi:hypothetical protein [Dendronalium sp. ChiSLP03b]|uniref:hypothetical protein n=1 Tax=Dendronalium sp. ChiSLP03b TaxID=3075381 RepID=UPI002AD1F8BA|nr:hypothetical protein [Dendronalium sp. ChiSLP03b]MDZ8209352.1 hypothetical protein [Dendronalium sp. ChiSLP03b]
MTLIQNSPIVKVQSPTLHLYYYRLHHGINESTKVVQDRRTLFSENLNKIVANLRSSTGKKGLDIVKLIPVEQEQDGTILDFANVPLECRKSNNDRLYFETGIIHSRLAARRFNDTYILRLIRYVPAIQGEQSLELFENLSEHLNDLDVELGQTVVFAGILKNQSHSQPTDTIAAECLSNYYSQNIPTDELIVNEFLDCPFYIYPQTVSVKKIDEYAIKSTKLACVFLYKDENVEKKADTFYNILQTLLLSYHKIIYFFSQSLILENILHKQYEAIERLSEDYAQRKWDSLSMLKLPQESLDYYKRLSFLEDQVRLIEIHQSNYRICIEEIEQKTGQKIPRFFADFENEINRNLKQIKADIGFLNPGIQLYEKLMLSVQTQISINENVIRDRQAKLGQLLTGVGAAIAIGQIVSQPMTNTLSLYIDKGKNQPSVTSLWLGALLTIALSLAIGYGISVKVYQWFTKDKF